MALLESEDRQRARAGSQWSLSREDWWLSIIDWKCFVTWKAASIFHSTAPYNLHSAKEGVWLVKTYRCHLPVTSCSRDVLILMSETSVLKARLASRNRWSNSHAKAGASLALMKAWSLAEPHGTSELRERNLQVEWRGFSRAIALVPNDDKNLSVQQSVLIQMKARENPTQCQPSQAEV